MMSNRLPKRPNVPGPSTVMVRFANRRTREAVYPARRNLRSFLKAIYINEDLNKSTTELFRQARQLVKSRQIGKAWTAAVSCTSKRQIHALGQRGYCNFRTYRRQLHTNG